MTGVVALSTITTIALVLGILVGLAFVGGFIALALRRRPSAAPDIPPGMKPGPPDEVLERGQLERVMGWGIAFTLLFAIAVAVVFLQEPAQNRADAIELIDRSIERGELWFRVAGEDNPTGFGCEQCHGEEGVGGIQTPFTDPATGGTRFFPEPALNDVCTRRPIEGPGGIREIIMQGSPNTPMPSWSVRFAGPMNDQQIQDLINYIVQLNERNPNVAPEDNQCLNPPTEGETTGGATPAAGDEASPSPGEEGGATPTPGQEATPAEEDATPGSP